MREANVFSFRRGMPRMSWGARNLYNLWQRTDRSGGKFGEITFSQSQLTLFQQRWRSKAVVRAYHGDHINEKIFKRWYLPGILPDVRPVRKFGRSDGPTLNAFAQRKEQAQRELKRRGEEEEKGLAPVGSLMFGEVERRIDVFIFRCCFAHSVYEARRLVVHGDVLLNGKKHQNANTRLAPGDMVSVNPESIRFLNANNEKDGFQLPEYASPFVFIPAYMEVSFGTCSGIYVRHPSARPGYSEIPTPFDADGEVIRLAWEWYAGVRPRLRSRRQLARMPENRGIVTT